MSVSRWIRIRRRAWSRRRTEVGGRHGVLSPWTGALYLILAFLLGVAMERHFGPGGPSGVFGAESDLRDLGGDRGERPGGADVPGQRAVEERIESLRGRLARWRSDLKEHRVLIHLMASEPEHDGTMHAERMRARESELLEAIRETEAQLADAVVQHAGLAARRDLLKIQEIRSATSVRTHSPSIEGVDRESLIELMPERSRGIPW